MIPESLQPDVASLRRRVFAAAFLVPFFSILAAFAIAPDTNPEPVISRTVTEPVALPEWLEPGLNNEGSTFVTVEAIRPSDSVAWLFDRLHINDQEALRFVENDVRGRDLLNLPPRRSVKAYTDVSGRLLSLRARLDQHVVLEVARAKDGELYATMRAAGLKKHTVYRAGEIESSLYAATDAADIPDPITNQLVKLFATDIDFHQDIRPGDQFSLIYEQYYDGGEPVLAGRLLAAEFIASGRPYQAVYFETATGQGDYYSPDGRNLRKAFLRSPLEFTRVNSGFSRSRFHPILHTWRAHNGVDLAAPAGTPILATADGEVSDAGYRGGYGNVIELRHHERYETLYAHLQRIHPQVRRGAKVRQGQVIGYVGATGWATGAHLHYEFRVGGVHHDPLGVKLPLSFPVQAEHRGRFIEQTQPLLARLNLTDGMRLARFD